MGVGERAAHLALVAAASELVREADELEGVLEAAHGEGLELVSGQDDEGRRSVVGLFSSRRRVAGAGPPRRRRGILAVAVALGGGGREELVAVVALGVGGGGGVECLLTYTKN